MNNDTKSWYFRKVDLNELTLPSYMTSLSQGHIDALTAESDVRVIACGVDPSDNSLVFVTNKLEVRQIVPNGKMVPLAAKPSQRGDTILVSFKDIDGNFEILTDLAHSVSKNLMLRSSIFLNHNYLVDLEEVELTIHENAETRPVDELHC